MHEQHKWPKNERIVVIYRVHCPSRKTRAFTAKRRRSSSSAFSACCILQQNALISPHASERLSAGCACVLQKEDSSAQVLLTFPLTRSRSNVNGPAESLQMVVLPG